MKLAFKYGADVDSTNRSGRTPLSFIAEHRNSVVTRLLLEAQDVDIYKADPHQRSPLTWASEMGRATVVELLLAAGVKEAPDCVENASTAAVWHRQAGIAEKLLVPATKYFECCIYRKPLLCSVASDGDEKITELFLTAGVNHDTYNGHRRTPLHLASGFHGGVMKLLIVAGTDVTRRDCNGRTPLMNAVEEGNESGVEVLLNVKGIRVHLRDQDWQTALSLVELKEHDEIVE
jgi:ankyrin repeat protein